MTREQAKQVLIGMGIEEPSDEQVSKYLDSVTGEVKKEKAANEKRISDLESALATSQREALTGKITSIFASAGMKGDAYTGAIKAFSVLPAADALNEAQSFVDGISTENKTALETAKAAWEKEVLKNTPNPGGGTKGGKKEEKSKAEEYFEKYLPSKETESKTIGTNAPVDYL